MTPEARYKQFHGRRSSQWTRKNFHYPKTLIFLGQAVSIVYLSNKKHGGGDGKICEYEHEFETPVDLYMDEKGKVQLYLIGQKLAVTDDGLIN
jgi:hypothetical protein